MLPHDLSSLSIKIITIYIIIYHYQDNHSSPLSIDNSYEIPVCSFMVKPQFPAFYLSIDASIHLSMGSSSASFIFPRRIPGWTGTLNMFGYLFLSLISWTLAPNLAAIGQVMTSMACHSADFSSWRACCHFSQGLGPFTSSISVLTYATSFVPWNAVDLGTVVPERVECAEFWLCGSLWPKFTAPNCSKCNGHIWT